MNIFNSIQLNKPKANNFDLSHDRKFTTKIGQLTPCLCMEVLPSDVINMQSEQMIRFMPLVSPAMQQMDVYTHYFFVPSRILWNHFQTAINGGEDGTDNHVFPYIITPNHGFPLGSVADYLGYPTDANSQNIKVSAIPLAGYHKIVDEYFRDENLSQQHYFPLQDGDNSANAQANNWYGSPLLRAYRKDYFTSALPFLQKGNEAFIPFAGGTADINYKSANPQPDKIYNDLGILEPENDVPLVVTNNSHLGINTTDERHIDNSDNLEVDLSTVQTSSINDFRYAVKLQEWLERNARAGSRYVETLLSHFGVNSSDKRLQRPEYLGGGKSPVSVSEVLQTSESNQTAQGNMAGHGINVGNSHAFNFRAEEHGYIIGIMSVIPTATYTQGVQRHLQRFDKLDFAWPTFAHLGEQAIKNKELFVTGTPSDEETFGYIPRYSEYRFIPSTCHGDMKGNLDYWHLGRKFQTQPVLSEEFISVQPDENNRIFAYQGNDDNLICYMFNKVQARRPLPRFGTPSI